MTTAFAPEALDEYHEAAQYAEDRFGLGRQFVAAVQAAIETIEASPERYQPVGRGVRIFRLKRLPYYIFYLHEAGSATITIYALAHHKRHPNYWRDRLPT
jgi:plasmid stabilization system protein ParE